MALLSALQTAQPPLPPSDVSQLGNAVVMPGSEGARPAAAAAAKSDSETMELKRRRPLPRDCPRCQQRLSEYEVDLNCQFAMCPNLDCTFPFDVPRLSEYFAHDDTVLPLRKRLKSRRSVAVAGTGSDGSKAPTFAAVTAAVASGKENAVSTRRPLQDGMSRTAIPGKGAGAHRSHSSTSLARVRSSISGNNGGSGARLEAPKTASYLSLSSSSPPPKVAAVETSIDSDGVDASGKGAVPWVDFAALDPGSLLEGIFCGASVPKSLGGGGGADDSIVRELFARSSTLFGGSFLPSEIIAASDNNSNSSGSEHGVGSGGENTPQLDLDAISKSMLTTLGGGVAGAATTVSTSVSPATPAEAISGFIASSDIFHMPAATAAVTTAATIESRDGPVGVGNINFDELFGDGSSAVAAALADANTGSSGSSNISSSSSSSTPGGVTGSLNIFLESSHDEGESQEASKGSGHNDDDNDLLEHLFS